MKAIELGAKVLSLSDSTGALIATDEEGFTAKDVHKIAAIKLERKSVTAAGLEKYKFVEGARPWTLVDKIDIALPCATQNEVSKEEAEALIKAGCRYVAEGSNMVKAKLTPSETSLKRSLSRARPRRLSTSLSTPVNTASPATHPSTMLQARHPTPGVSPCLDLRCSRMQPSRSGRPRKSMPS